MKTIRLMSMLLFVMAGVLLLVGQNQAVAQYKDKFPGFAVASLAGPDSVNIVKANPVNRWWRQFWGPNCGNIYNSYQWSDSLPSGLSAGDTLRLKQTYPSVYNLKAHVDSLKGSQGVDSLRVYLTLLEQNPSIPTITQWGFIVLVVLLITSAIFILLKRRKATVPA